MTGRNESRFARWQQRRAFNTARRAAFYSDLARFSESGIPSFRAVEKMAEIAKKRRHKHLEAIYRRIMARTGEGGSIAVGLAPEVPGTEAVMLTGAAAAGSAVVQSILQQLAGLLDRQVVVSSKLRKVLVSNGVTLAVIAAVVTMVMVVVVPQLKDGATAQMQMMMHFAPGYFAFGDAFLHFGPVVLGLFIGLAGWSVWALPRWHRPRPYWRRNWFDRNMLPFTFYARMQTTFFLSTVASMMQAGIPVRDVLSGMQAHATPWMRSHLRRMLRTLATGDSAVDALNSGLLPQDTADRLSVYALIPDVTTVMRRLADDNFLIYEQRIDAIAALLKMVSIVVLAMFAAATLFAIFDFSNALAAGSKLPG